jgi:hypothetical protein
MNEFLVLHMLKERLQLIEGRMESREAAARNPANTGPLYEQGALTELRSEQAFLRYLIGEMEREGEGGV